MVLNRVLVTGASGMVGRQIAAILAAAGIGCIATSRTRPDALPSSCTWVAADLTDHRDPAALDALFGDVDAIVHTAAIIPASDGRTRPRSMFDINVGASIDLAQWATENNLPFVFLSSSSVYAEPDRDGIVETDPTGANALAGLYGISKLTAEMALGAQAELGLKLAVIRPSAVYGPGLPEGKMLANFLATVRNGGTISLNPPVEDRIDFVYAGDVARAVRDVLTHAVTGTFNIGAGQLCRIDELAEACVRAAGRGDVSVRFEKPSREPITRFGLDCALARAQFGYAPAYPLDAGLAAMLSAEPARHP